MPDLRFAIGAVLAVALLIVAVFGLAATVQMAHHRSVTPDDGWRTLAFPDPTDWSLLADRSRPATVAKTELPEVPPASVALTTPAPEPTEAVKPSEREVPQETEAAERAEQPALDTPPATIAATSLPAPTEFPVVALEQEPEPVDVVAAIPDTKAEPIQPSDVPPAIKGLADEDEPLEPSERVGTLPGFPNAGHGFVPPEHPIATPVPLPPSKPAIKKPHKKRVARNRLRWFLAPLRANTRYPLFGSDKFGVDSKTAYDKKWTTAE
jgi:hypothetical protein